ncbi:nuclear envelope integral membrane protein 1a isoform X1 [Schistocerca gregaria]|uniref:nuclear envelope integral membrane protein 1a isoform X1 n=1 Tax=Schistocerca gregaria TaxID=7010 RepID=UPI00211E969E|nr:nuclear envelope integral membrane protein 1a isoform X1 [Schistocerca gregaria]
MALFMKFVNEPMWKITYILLIIVVCQPILSETYTLPFKVHDMYPDDNVTCDCSYERHFEIYCYPGKPKHVLHTFETVTLKINVDPSNYDVYLGHTPEEVAEQLELQQSSWSFNLLSSKSNIHHLDPFNRTCVGVYNMKRGKYTVELLHLRVDYWRVLLIAVAMLTFMSAPQLSENSLFYYICGISLGITASFLILTYFISRLFPKRPLMYGFLIGGSTVALYIVQTIWGNLQLILQQYQKYVLLYIGCTGLISFIVCYRLGPVSDPRSKNLIKWALQGMGLWLIYSSTCYQEAAVALMLTVIMCYNFPSVWISKLQAAWKRRFPPKLKLLSEEEYYEQGVRETKKALEELRGYCSSPECDTWKTVLKLKNPVRFAEFMKGDSHLSDDEMVQYEVESRHSTADYDYSDEEEED